MAKICPCQKRSTKGKPKPTSKNTKTTLTQQQQQQQQQKNKQLLEKKQKASQIDTQNASSSATVINQPAQLECQSIELEKRERDIAQTPSSSCIESPPKKKKKKNKRSRKAGKGQAQKATPTHQAEPSSLGASSDIPHVNVQAAGSTATATQAMQEVASIESTPSVASQSPSPSKHQQRQQLDEATLTFLALAHAEEASKVKEEEDEMTIEALMKMGFNDIYNMFEPSFQDSYRRTQGIVELRQTLDIQTFTMAAALQRHHPNERARTIASMRVQHEKELEQLYADHCKRTADDKEAMRTAHRENTERAKRAAEKDAWHRRRDSERKYARMVEDGHRMSERCRLAPLIRSRLVQHFADAG